MPKGSNSKNSDDDFEFKRKNDDFGLDQDPKGFLSLIQAKDKAKVIFTNAVTLHVANSIIPILLFITTAKNLITVSFRATRCIMVNCFRVLPKIEVVLV